jgi:RNA polymerase sigma-70 factor (ECF subfamily)
MVRNRALNYVRDARRKEKKEASFLTIHLSVPEEQTESEKLKNWLTESIEKLPPKTRTVFVNFYLERLSQKKIAEMLKISPNTVNNHVESARKFMRKHLKNLKDNSRS